MGFFLETTGLFWKIARYCLVHTKWGGTRKGTLGQSLWVKVLDTITERSKVLFSRQGGSRGRPRRALADATIEELV